VFKRLADGLCRDRAGLVYSHKLPGGRWLPGGASSTGGEWIRAEFSDVDLAAADRDAVGRLPSDAVAYPLIGTGERFPFKAAEAIGFIEPAPDNADRYAAMLQGTALFERLCYDRLDVIVGADASAPGDVYVTGGGASSDVWMQFRADVTGRVMRRPARPEAAVGTAVLAAAGTCHEDLWAAIDAMVRVDHHCEPDTTHRARYDELYGRLVDAMKARGWLHD